MLERWFANYTVQVPNNQGKVHLLLALSPTPPLGEVYQVVFEKVLGEKVSTSPVALVGR